MLRPFWLPKSSNKIKIFDINKIRNTKKNFKYHLLLGIPLLFCFKPDFGGIIRLPNPWSLPAGCGGRRHLGNGHQVSDNYVWNTRVDMQHAMRIWKPCNVCTSPTYIYSWIPHQVQKINLNLSMVNYMDWVGPTIGSGLGPCDKRCNQRFGHRWDRLFLFFFSRERKREAGVDHAHFRAGAASN